jgi:HD-like signal output (HDOD) protein
MSIGSVTPSRRSDAIGADLDRSRSRGPLQHILIPPCPELLAQLQAAMAAAEPDLNAVARIASSDVAMSATLLRRANSPLLKGAGQACTTVGQAMTRLGLQETAAVMLAFLLQNAMPVDERKLARFWQRSTKRALAMSFIAEQLPGLSPGLAHSFGLFLHVGIPVLLQSVRGYAATMVEAGARIDRSYVETENANHKTDHAVVGALVVRVWHLPPELMCAVRLHHDFNALGTTDIAPEVQTLIAAGLVAEWLMRRHEGLPEDADWANHHAAAMAWLHIDSSDLEHWEEALAAPFDEA